MYLKDYIEYHKDTDSCPDKDINLTYQEKMCLWDRNFMKRIYDNNIFDEFLKLANYLMYDTLISKLCCYIAYSETFNDYIQLFDNNNKII